MDSITEYLSSYEKEVIKRKEDLKREIQMAISKAPIHGSFDEMSTYRKENVLKPVTDAEMPDDFFANSVLLKEGEENLYFWLSHEVQLLDWGHPTSKEKIIAARTALKNYAHEYKHWKAAAELESVEEKRL